MENKDSGEIKQRRDGENVKCLIDMFRTSQTELARKMGIPDSKLSLTLAKNIIDDETLDDIAAALGNGLTKEFIKNYNHEDTKAYIVNNFFSGGKAYNQGSISSDNSTNTYNELDFIREYGNIKAELMYYRMLAEPDEVKAEMLARRDKAEEFIQ